MFAKDVTSKTFLAVFKRGTRGVYQHCSEDHIARCAQAFASCSPIVRRSDSKTLSGPHWRSVVPKASVLTY